jgi:hypothetical protein
MDTERVEFSLVHGTEGDFPRPYPANREIPDWFKSMPTEVADVAMGTVKSCPPFLEAMTCGYIMPLLADVSLTVDENGVFHGNGPTLSGESCGQFRQAQSVVMHHPSQSQGTPFGNFPVVKIFNPWLIQTPPGYSTLFLPTLNRFHMPFIPLSGLVETDLFYREVHFPAILTIARGTTLNLARGTPMVQIIPIKRADFQAEFVPLKVDKYCTGRPNTLPKEHSLYPDDRNFYKNNFWRKKNYR